MGNTSELEPKVGQVYIHAEDWLIIRFDDLAGVQSRLYLHTHHVGSWGEIILDGVNREFLQQLSDGLTEILKTFPETEKDTEKPNTEEEAKG